MRVEFNCSLAFRTSGASTWHQPVVAAWLTSGAEAEVPLLLDEFVGRFNSGGHLELPLHLVTPCSKAFPCGRNSVGRMPASQAGRRRFGSGRPLWMLCNYVLPKNRLPVSAADFPC